MLYRGHTSVFIPKFNLHHNRKLVQNYSSTTLDPSMDYEAGSHSIPWHIHGMPLGPGAGDLIVPLAILQILTGGLRIVGGQRIGIVQERRQRQQQFVHSESGRPALLLVQDVHTDVAQPIDVAVVEGGGEAHNGRLEGIGLREAHRQLEDPALVGTALGSPDLGPPPEQIAHRLGPRPRVLRRIGLHYLGVWQI